MTTRGNSSSTRPTTYIGAVNRALMEQMAADPTVCVFGEDVAVGGAFGATRGLLDRYGPLRVRNTPISESAIVGMAVGAAALGLRPVVEVMFIDFLTFAMDALVNHAAKLRAMSGGQLRVPMVLRTQNGALGGAGAQHSQSLEAWLTHVPGLKVVTPATPADAFGLLRASIADGNPVVFIEHKGSYTRREILPDVDVIAPLGRAGLVRRGDDVTVVTYGGGVATAAQAADTADSRGISVEVIDLRTLVPLDLETLARSATKTGRVVVYHEAVRFGGFGGELSAQIHEACFTQLRAPVARVGARAIPIPAAPDLEQAVLPNTNLLLRGLDEVIGS